MEAPSLRRIVLEAGGSTSGISIRRHLAPRTAGLLLRALPVSGNAHGLGGSAAYVVCGIGAGLERPRSSFSRGDVAFLPRAQAVCFFTGDAEPGPMTPLGTLEDPGILDGIGGGDRMRIYAGR
ncbi:MAG: hypothetical protein MPI95_00245 [Nitrosopumilus sp.]|nr:hypothetical protein [Nitrosopumilus sp.]MDA7943233.1 hypothetical protein [Nitrosopumilus sp.]MDA7952372.1 hypothetical protein [Nitrosopumilus sp.]MDA7957510.1 hypothetical protein [Nitrosopumilus sp.]MDA7959628.1 hypothetical protein [Nitrosopumilus sp.]